jgi:hypothetical protein
MGISVRAQCKPSDLCDFSSLLLDVFVLLDFSLSLSLFLSVHTRDRYLTFLFVFLAVTILRGGDYEGHFDAPKT